MRTESEMFAVDPNGSEFGGKAEFSVLADGCANSESFVPTPSDEERAVKENEKLVIALARRFVSTGKEFDDLYQVGMIGLLRAVRGFDRSRGVCFSTYAVPVILGEIRRFLRDDTSLRVPRGMKETAIKIRKTELLLRVRFGREAKLSEICEECGVSREEALRALEATEAPLSFQSPVTPDSDVTLGETVPDPMQDPTLLLDLKECVRSLSAEERKIVALRFFYGKTQRETAEILNLTQVGVSRKERRLLESLRERMGEEV